MPFHGLHVGIGVTVVGVEDAALDRMFAGGQRLFMFWPRAYLVLWGVLMGYIKNNATGSGTVAVGE